MNRFIAIVWAILVTNTIGTAVGGEEENEIYATCLLASGGSYKTFAGCTARGLVYNELFKFGSPEFLGPNSLLRQATCGVAGLGCPDRPYDNYLMGLMPYKNGVIAIFRSGTYYSPDGKNLRGGGRTIRSWPGKGDEVLSLVNYNGDIIAAFRGAVFIVVATVRILAAVAKRS